MRIKNSNQHWFDREVADSENTYGKLVIVFQRFKQFDVELRHFMCQSQKPSLHRIFKTGYTFLNLEEYCSMIWGL